MEETINIAVHGNNDGSIWDKVAAQFGQNSIDILEIGVYKAAQIGEAYSRCHVHSYTGVDPYFGDASDPYRGSYWKDETASFDVYRKSQLEFGKYGGGVLYKTTSEIFFRSLEAGEKFDVILIDGDHRFLPALQDMVYWFSRLSEGGMMIVDDYANVDTPDVTPAVNCFLGMYKNYISKVDEHCYWFKNRTKHIPVCTKHIYIYKKCDRFYDHIPRKQHKKKYLWGAGQTAKRSLERWGDKAEFDGILDNAKMRTGEWNGLPVCRLEQIRKEDSLIVVATDIYYDEIKRQLCDLGFQEGNDFVQYAFFELFWLNESWFE